jgi:CopG family transcriptional regulator/antitoxin EndoAI
VGELRRIMITVPAALLQEVDGMVALEKGRTRSEFVREALHRFLEDRKRREIRDRMKTGYLEMARLNLQLAEEGLSTEEDVDEVVQTYLAEAESE